MTTHCDHKGKFPAKFLQKHNNYTLLRQIHHNTILKKTTETISSTYYFIFQHGCMKIKTKTAHESHNFRLKSQPILHTYPANNIPAHWSRQLTPHLHT